MKAEPGFIPDNISAISGASLHIQPTNNFEHSEAHPDSTDMFIDEILRQRAERLQREDEKGETLLLSNLQSKALHDGRDLQENTTPSDFRVKQLLRNSMDRHNKFQILNFQNESIQEKSEVEEGNDSKSDSKVKPQLNKSAISDSNQPVVIEDRIETLQNQTNQQFTMEKQSNFSSNMGPKKWAQKEDSQNKFVLPKIDKISNIQHQNVGPNQSNFGEQKQLKQNSQYPNSQKKGQLIDNSMQHINNQVKIDLVQHSQLGQPKKVDDLKQSYSQFKEQKNKSASSNKPSSKGPYNQLQKDIQALEAKQDSRAISILQTPMKLFNEPQGVYEFVENKNSYDGQSDKSYRQMAKAITEHLNRNQKEQQVKSPAQIDFSLGNQRPRKSTTSFKNISIRDPTNSQRKDSEKVDVQQDDLQTQYSQFSRDVKILEHRYDSNRAYLQAQISQLLGYYNFMIMQQEKKQLRKSIMAQQIQNNKEKIHLRTASYTKRFNFISPMAKNNDRPIQFKSKQQVSQVLVAKCDNLKKQIEAQKKTHVENQAKLHLLNKYYDLMKARTISDNLQFATEYQFDSKIGMFSPIKAKNSSDQSYCSIAMAIDQASLSKNGQSNSKSKLSFRKTNTLNQVGRTKKDCQIQRTPQAVYNIMKYKTEIAKDMIVQFEVFNLGRIKRIRDQTKIIKQQMEFIDQQIVHFQKSYGEEMKAYDQRKMPKINYNAFKVQQKQGQVYSKSPFCRDYHANNKGMNNINIYRPDSAFTSPRKLNKSLSQSRYTIRRQNHNQTSRSKYQPTTIANIKDTSKQKQIKQKLLLRKTFTSPQPSCDQYGLYTMGQNLQQIKQFPVRQNNSKQLLRPYDNQRSLSARNKNITRFRTQQNTNNLKSPVTKRKLRTGFTADLVNASKTNAQAQCSIKLQQSVDKKA